MRFKSMRTWVQALQNLARFSTRQNFVAQGRLLTVSVNLANPSL